MNKPRLALLSIILVALALRLYNLTYHSLWFDEAMSVHWARQSLPRILEVGFSLAEDRLPPLYYLLLKGWAGLAGFSETGVRSLSVLFGVLLVPVVAAVAGRLFHRRVALLSAGLVALNPFLIWYAQEARMYASAVFFASLGVWAWLNWTQTHTDFHQFSSDFLSACIRENLRPISWLWPCCVTFYELRFYAAYFVLFVLSFMAAVYNHLYAGFLLPGLGLWLILAYPRRWGLWLTFAVAGLLITLAYVPILLAIWRFSAESPPGDPFSGLANRAWWLLQAFTVWQAPLPAWLKATIPVVIALLALLAFLPHQPAPNRNQPPVIEHQPQPSTPPPPHPDHPSPILPSSHPPSPQPSNPPPLLSFGSAQDKPSHPSAPLRTSLPILQPSNPPTLQPPNPPSLHPSILPSFLLLLPFLIANLLLFRNQLAFFGERYFIVMLPWLLILVAAGVEGAATFVTSRFGPPSPTSLPDVHHYRRQRTAFWLISLVPLLLLVLALPGQWSLPASKEAWRQSVAYLAEHATPQDGILIHPDWVRYPFQYYFRGPGQTYAAFSTITSATDLDGPLQGVVGDHPVVWLIQSHLAGPDPDRRVEAWFAARYPLITELYPPGISLKGYAPGYRLDALPATATPLDVAFANGLRLVGLEAGSTVAATDNLFHPPSGWLHLTLYWTADRPIIEAASPYVHLVGPEGVWGMSLDRANDALSFFPPSRWAAEAPGQLIRHDLDINLNPATPPGAYDLSVGLPDSGQQQRISVITVE